MLKLTSFLSVIVLALATASTAEAACTGSVGSTDLSCTSDGVTLDAFTTWVQTVYVPEAIQKAMSAFAVAYRSENDPGMSGSSQVADEWGPYSNRSVFVSSVNLDKAPWYMSSDSTINKSPSSHFFIEGVTDPNFGANTWLDLTWVNTVTEVVDGTMDFVASYNYSFNASAWGAVNSVWVQNATIAGSGTGTYNFGPVSAVAVPGPEAGTGFGALAVGGLVLMVLRRQIQI